MTTYLSPGVSIRETDFSYYVAQLSTSACGVIGAADDGEAEETGRGKLQKSLPGF